MRAAHLVGALVLIGGCRSGATTSISATSASSAEPDAPPTGGSFEGIYAVERITRNRSGCANEGPAVEPEVKFYFLRFADAFGSRILTGGGQTNLEDCVRLVKEESIQIYHPVVFSRSLDSAEPKGDMGQSAIPKDGVCHANSEAQLVRWVAPNEIRIELRKTLVDYPGKEIRDCSTGNSVDAAVGKPCTALTVITARRQQPLP